MENRNWEASCVVVNRADDDRYRELTRDLDISDNNILQARQRSIDLFTSRRAGLLLHPTSLPGPSESGDLGQEAHRFIDFLVSCGMSVWQTLPLGPTHDDRSPYQCLSVHAGNEQLISLQWLVDRGWLDQHLPPENGVDARKLRRVRLAAARNGFKRHAENGDREAYTKFRDGQSHWLDDYALYMALREDQHHKPWFEWHLPLRNRDPAEISAARKRLAASIEQVCFEQFVFYRQWDELRAHAHERGITLFGDLPIFVAHDSADVWVHRDLFTLNDAGQLEVVAGVPPDYFSETGQRWGNPLYHWERIEADDFNWWIERVRTQLGLFDLVRLDHFRGFEKYWEIPAESETAENGHWVSAPGTKLFYRLYEEFRSLPLVAEDLGVITPEVEAMRRQFAFPGMKILQFAFEGGPSNPYLPHNHELDCVVYTGTHDNDTTAGWFSGLADEQKQYVIEYLGSTGNNMPWPMIRAALMSVSCLSVLPLQDVLGLGSEHRMNIPGRSGNNWQWRFQWDQIPENLDRDLRHLVELYGRIG